MCNFRCFCLFVCCRWCLFVCHTVKEQKPRLLTKISSSLHFMWCMFQITYILFQQVRLREAFPRIYLKYYSKFARYNGHISTDVARYLKHQISRQNIVTHWTSNKRQRKESKTYTSTCTILENCVLPLNYKFISQFFWPILIGNTLISKPL